MCGLQICESGTLAFSTATISAFNLGPSNDMALSQGQFFWYYQCFVVEMHKSAFKLRTGRGM